MRDSKDDDFYNADVPTDADPSPLRTVILAQAHEPGGAVVLLFTSATLTSDGDSQDGGQDGVQDGVDGGQTNGSDLVVDTATELELAAVPPDLFSTDAYLLQSALGERLLPGDA